MYVRLFRRNDSQRYLRWASNNQTQSSVNMALFIRLQQLQHWNGDGGNNETDVFCIYNPLLKLTNYIILIMLVMQFWPPSRYFLLVPHLL
jgi:hypothetical protein